MMKLELRIMFEYQCYPIWIYDENGRFIDNNLPSEVALNIDLVKKIDEVQNVFESLYLNTNTEFKYIGFPSIYEKINFKNKVNDLYKTLHSKLKGIYNITINVNLDNM